MAPWIFATNRDIGGGGGPPFNLNITKSYNFPVWSAFFVATAEGDTPFSYIWSTDDAGATIVSGNASATQILFSAEGTWNVTVEITNSAGSNFITLPFYIPTTAYSPAAKIVSAGGEIRYVTSSDITLWLTPTVPPPEALDLYHVAFTPNGYVASSEWASYPPYRSVDGLEWYIAALRIDASGGWVRRLIYDLKTNTLWAIGSSIWRSFNFGTTWSLVYEPPEHYDLNNGDVKASGDIILVGMHNHDPDNRDVLCVLRIAGGIPSMMQYSINTGGTAVEASDIKYDAQRGRWVAIAKVSGISPFPEPRFYQSYNDGGTWSEISTMSGPILPYYIFIGSATLATNGSGGWIIGSGIDRWAEEYGLSSPATRIAVGEFAYSANYLPEVELFQYGNRLYKNASDSMIAAESICPSFSLDMADTYLKGSG